MVCRRCSSPSCLSQPGCRYRGKLHSLPPACWRPKDSSLPLVIVIAAAAAIIGDNAGYWIGRAAGRRLLERWRPVARYTEKMLPPAERFFAHHGGKAVFLARFIPGLRVIGALVAGIAGMEWGRFLVWDMAGGGVWGTRGARIAVWLGEG